ncbi:MAG: NPCBM/NEW2 domain-containing protein [Pirellulales bacterium]|nr:NPCBM/NEW2 domain-containing protein [Pirellulales bacterium]
MPWRQSVFYLVFANILMMPSLGRTMAWSEETPPGYVSSDLAYRISSITQGWGKLGMDTAVQSPHAPAQPLRIKDKQYAHGLGHHANGQVVVDLNGQFQTFQSDIGIQWQGGQNMASVVFRVFVDDRKVFESGVMREGDEPQSLTVTVTGADELILVADDAGDGITCDCANWGDARLVADPAAAQRPAVAGVDIAPFGKIVTWDPQRMTGTAADRVHEFPAADIRLYRDVLPEGDGTYRVPVTGASGCIGLRWDENRMLRQVALAFTDAAAIPSPEKIQLQIWSGESAWQGKWEPVSEGPERIGNQLLWNLGPRGIGVGTQQIRWVFSDLKTPCTLTGLHAHSRTRWTTVDIRIESTRPADRKPIQIALRNGLFVGDPQADPYRRTWDRAKPLRVQVQAAITKRYKADRTVLQFLVPELTFGVAIEDLLANDCVWVPHAGVFVVRVPAPVTSAEYFEKIAGKKTLLSEVREKPDQTFAQALAVVGNPIQNHGPMMLSLACDNRKFVVEREGRILFDTYVKFDDPERPMPQEWQLVPRFGDREDHAVSRQLGGGWIPMPVTTVIEGNCVYRQCTYVAPIDDEPPSGSPSWVRQRAVGVVEYSIENQGEQACQARFSLALRSGEASAEAVTWEQAGRDILIKTGDRLLAWIDISKLKPLEVHCNETNLTWSGILSPGNSAQCVGYLPAWPATSRDRALLIQSAPYAPRVERYWNSLLQPAMQVDLPDEFLTNVIRASQVHCLLAARNEDVGCRVSPWISSDRYGPLESEANSIVRGMGLLGHDAFARRSLDYFIRRYNEAGYLTTGYTMVGTGEHLWTLAEHYERTQDKAWLQAIAPEVSRVCQWVAAQQAKTRQLDGRGEKVTEYGLFPPGVTADWNRFAYRFFNDAQYCAGLESAARMLDTMHHPDAPALLKAARQYREDLVRAYRQAQGRSPVVRLNDGTWVPADPALLDCPGRVEDFLPDEDGNRSWAYSVEIGAHHLAATGILDPAAPDIGWMMDYLEEQQFLRSGMGDYPEAKNRQDPFHLGGFAKVQPYYGRFAEVYACRDDIKPFIRSYFNAIPSLLSQENLSFWEHFHNIGGWNKTHETGWFLCQSRIMLASERGDALWLAPFVPSAWMTDGNRIAIRKAPTRFGRVDYTLESAVARRRIDATIEPPTREPPRCMILRVRHPNGESMRSVTVDGKSHRDFDPGKETVTLIPSGSTMHIRVDY